VVELRIPFEELVSILEGILLDFGFSVSRASLGAELFAKASLDGVASHGINRFPVFLDYIGKGYVDVSAVPELDFSTSIFEKWDGNLGAGNLNAFHCMKRAIEMAKLNGIGCTAIRNTNHWMRAGNYGWQAADAGCIGICFTNTKPNMPAWGGAEPLLGNNPLVIAIPRKKGHLVLDMALAQFSYGRIEQYLREEKLLPYDAGFDSEGNLTREPDTIFKNELALPVGLWKGAGLSFMIDILASMLSEGNATHQIGDFDEEHSISQVFISLYPPKLGIKEYPEDHINSIIENLKSLLVFGDSYVRYPGEATLRTRQANLEAGVPVDKEIWEQVLSYRE
jgi:3-dehydro-L-gulonate 2-dehydrogenase